MVHTLEISQYPLKPESVEIMKFKFRPLNRMIVLISFRSAHKCASFAGGHILLFKKNLPPNQPSAKFDLSLLQSLISESHS